MNSNNDNAAICEKLKARRNIGETVDPFDFGSPLAIYLASPDEINIDPYIEYMLLADVEDGAATVTFEKATYRYFRLVANVD